MTRATYNFLCDTLQEEINLHAHKDELLALMGSQIMDDASFYTQNGNAWKVHPATVQSIKNEATWNEFHSTWPMSALNCSKAFVH